MTESESIELDEKAKIFADKLFPCEPPCDSYGVCSNCCERMTFEAGYEFGLKAEREKFLELLQITRKIRKHYHGPNGMDEAMAAVRQLDELIKKYSEAQ